MHAQVVEARSCIYTYTLNFTRSLGAQQFRGVICCNHHHHHNPSPPPLSRCLHGLCKPLSQPGSVERRPGSPRSCRRCPATRPAARGSCPPPYGRRRRSCRGRTRRRRASARRRRSTRRRLFNTRRGWVVVLLFLFRKADVALLLLLVVVVVVWWWWLLLVAPRGCWCLLPCTSAVCTSLYHARDEYLFGLSANTAVRKATRCNVNVRTTNINHANY